ncbi:DUF3280 domain-containing protein [Methylobacterium gnaphalii]|nr:DUF3280 domain-containing protein [Methylobacterium gnaphalii]
MRAFRRLALAAVAMVPLLPAAASAEAGRKAAVFTAELDDPMLPYGRKPPPAVLKRLDLITDELRKTLVDKGKLESVDLVPQSEEIKKQAPLFKCNGCVPDIAKALGADYAVTTVAEKGGPQLFNLSVTITEVASGKVVRKGIVVINANSDDDWAHAARSVVKNRLLAEPLPNAS